MPPTHPGKNEDVNKFNVIGKFFLALPFIYEFLCVEMENGEY